MTGDATTTWIEIRLAKRADVPAIVNLLADDELGREREDFQDPLPERYFAAFDAIVADASNALIVAEDHAGKVVGCLQLSFVPGLSYRGGERALIEDVRVDAAYRGRKIGHQLVEWAIEEAGRHGCCLVQLFVHEVRTEARRFYEDIGFKGTHSGMRLSLR